MNYGAFLRLLLSHLDLVQELAPLASNVATETTFEGKWDRGVGPIGHILAPVADEFKALLTAPSAQSNDELVVMLCDKLNGGKDEFEAAASPWDGSRIRKMYDNLAPILTLVLPLILKLLVK